MNLYYPQTTISKPTWQDPNQTVQNTTPVQLDANGCAIIWGIGSYRQQLFTGPVVGGATSGNLVFDLTTTDISSQFNLAWGGQATGSTNNIQLQLASWNPTAGFNIQFIPIGGNTGSVTLSPNTGVTPISVLKDTNTGPVGLTGGELGPGDVANVVYDSTAAIFHLQNPVGAAGGSSGVPVGTEISCPGFNPPSNFLFEYGQAVSRTTYSGLLAQLTSIQGATLNSTTTVTGLNSTEQLAAGMAVEGAGVPGGATIQSISSSTAIILSTAATTTGASSLTFFVYGNGDGSTTFNLPDRRGRLLVGRDNMGNSIAGTLTTTFTTTTPDALGQNLVSPAGAAGGGITVAKTNLPSYNLAVTIPGGQAASAHTHTFITTTGGGGGGQPAPGNGVTLANGTTASANIGTLTGTAATGGSGTAISPITPSQTTNMCIRVQ